MLSVKFNLHWYIAHNCNYRILATPARSIDKTCLKISQTSSQGDDRREQRQIKWILVDKDCQLADSLTKEEHYPMTL